MEIDLSQLDSLPLTYVVLFACLLVSIISAIAIFIYVGIRAGVEAWKERRIERAKHETWSAQQERIDRGRK